MSDGVTFEKTVFTGLGQILRAGPFCVERACVTPYIILIFSVLSLHKR